MGWPSGDLQGSCASLHYMCSSVRSDLCGSFAVCVSESLLILAPSPPSWFAGFLVSIGEVSCFHWCLSVWRCQLAATSWGGSRFQGCHGNLSLAYGFWLPANPLGTSSQAHLFKMSLTLWNMFQTSNFNLINTTCKKNQTLNIGRLIFGHFLSHFGKMIVLLHLQGFRDTLTRK